MRRLISWLLTLVVVAGLAYTGYVGYEGSRQLVEASTDPADCRIVPCTQARESEMSSVSL